MLNNSMLDPREILPTNKQAFITVTEIDSADLQVSDLFKRKFAHPPPDCPHHVVGHYRDAGGESHLACYIHFREFGESLLGGGACVDDRVLRRMSAEERSAVREAGGLYHLALSWSVRHFAPRCLAVFGFCGDGLAERVDLSVGFVRTVHPKLLVYFTRELDLSEQSRLIAEAHANGPF